MRWFKHMTASWDDERHAQLIGKGGIEGLARYGLYWRVQEIIAGQMDSKLPEPSCSVRYNVTRWSSLLSLRGSLVFSTLSTLAATRLVSVERDGDEIIVTNRNLLKYRDEYSKKSRHNHDNSTPRTDTEGDTEGDTDKYSSSKPSALKENRVYSEIEQEEIIYNAYPRKVGRIAALKAIEKAVKKISKGNKDHPSIPDAREARIFLWKKVSAYAKSPAGRPPPKGCEDYRPHPQTWFNKGRYWDDPEEWDISINQNGGNNGSSGRIGNNLREHAAAEAEALGATGQASDGYENPYDGTFPASGGSRQGLLEDHGGNLIEGEF